jgi:hypothetical protein
LMADGLIYRLILCSRFKTMSGTYQGFQII